MAATGEGKDRRGDYQGTLADASSCKHPGLGGFPGWQGLAVERRQAAAAHVAWPVGTAVPGVERAVRHEVAGCEWTYQWRFD